MSTFANRIGIDDSHYSGYRPQRTNESVAFRNQGLHRAIRRMPIPNSLRLSDSRLKRVLRGAYYRLNSLSASDVPDSHLGLLNELDAEFADSVSRLEAHFDLDLGPWRVRRT